MHILAEVGEGNNQTATHSLQGFGLQMKVLLAKLFREVTEENQVFISRAVCLTL